MQDDVARGLRCTDRLRAPLEEVAGGAALLEHLLRALRGAAWRT